MNLLLGVCLLMASGVVMASKKDVVASKPAAASAAGKLADVTKLQMVDTKIGTGAAAKSGDRVKVHYTGMLTNGNKFDSSVDRGQPFEFNLGAGQVIQGWDKGVEGMKVGGKRRLSIPYQEAYGEQGRPPVIPPKATLHFDIELLDIVKR